VAFSARWAASLTAVVALACSGKVTEPGAPDDVAGSGATGGSSTGGSGTGGSGTGGSSTGGSTGLGGTSGKGGSSSGGSSGSSTEPPVGGVLPVTRAARLTHAQYQNTVNDLFGITDNSAAAFAPDALDGMAFDTSIDFRVDSRLGPQYRAAAEALAAKAVADDAIFSRIVPCDTASASCKGDFIEGFGQRAFRRPLSSAESARFATLFDQGPDLVASGDAFKDGVALVVEAMLQSPQFLYRTEQSATEGSNGLIALDDWELASRLSYFLWNTMPNDALFQSARGGSLRSAAQVASQALGMVGDARATTVAVSFHHQAWDVRFSHIAPDRNEFENAPADLAARATSAAEAFFGEVVKTDGGLAEMLTAPYAFADSALAPLYGVTVSGNGMTRIDFDADERRGFLMQVGHLASNAYALKTDPIHRGLFVVRNLLCHPIDDPPPGASQTEPPETDTPPKTTREEVELLTGQAACRGCHGDINPPGFAFEAFDAVGQIREDEDGEPLVTSGSMQLDGQTLAFDDAFDVVEALATSAEARACYASKWLEFAYGRSLITEDQAAQASIGMSGASVREVMRAVTATPQFMTRAPNEVGP
jgi:hypothetical protein